MCVCGICTCVHGSCACAYMCTENRMGLGFLLYCSFHCTFKVGSLLESGTRIFQLGHQPLRSRDPDSPLCGTALEAVEYCICLVSASSFWLSSKLF